MGPSAGFDGEHFSVDTERNAVVASASGLISEWDGVLAQNPGPGDVRLRELGHRATLLDPRLRGVGFGGVGHHLSELARLVEARAAAAAVRAQLEVVRELVQHAAHSLAPVAPPQPAPQVSAPAAGDGFAPPPLLTMFRPDADAPEPRRAEPPRASAPPPDTFAPPPLVAFGPPPVEAAPVLPAPEAPPALHHPVAGAPPPPRAPDPADPLRPDAPAPLAPSPSREVGQAFAEAPRPAPFRPEGAAPGPNLLVRSMLGLRAFGRGGKPGGAPAEAAAAEPGGEARPSLLGLKRRSGPPEPPRLSHQMPKGGPLPLPPSAEPAPPPLVNEGRSGLPPLPKGPLPVTPEQRDGSSPGLPGRDLFDRLEHARDSKNPRAPGRRGRLRVQERSTWDWRLGLLAGVGFLGVVAIIVAFAVRSSRDDERSATPSGSASVASGSGSAAPGGLPRGGRLLTDNERFRSLIQQVHGRGEETPELRALLEEQASLHAGALSDEPCTGSPAECDALAKARELFSDKPVRVVRRREKNQGWKSKWLAGLKMPEIPVEDDPIVQRRFEFYTENPVGRETFQQMLFRCGAHKDLIQTALIRRGLPADLIAVVYAESGCAPKAKSPAGAEGLWQFMPDAARAYHLRIIEGVVDERHSPAKSTEAAVRYFAGLRAKLSSWDLCFAAYNMGPFGLIARIERAGGDVGFWDLVDSDLIPDETAGYAPTIQAVALILNNLQRLKFTSVQMGAPQITADLEVPPNTRLSMIARAAATSLTELRRLNLDLKSDRTPNLPNFAVQVPKDVVWQARDTLQELVKNRDDADLCTPPTFDWGRQRFTAEMAKNCQRVLANSPEAPAPEAPSPQGPGVPGTPNTLD